MSTSSSDPALETELVTCFVTTPPGDAATIARAVVEARLAACASIVPAVQSIYRWQGEVEEAEEALLVMKTTAAAVPGLTEAVRAVHPYDTFELIALPITDGSAPYLAWIADSVEAPRRP